MIIGWEVEKKHCLEIKNTMDQLIVSYKNAKKGKKDMDDLEMLLKTV